MTPHCCRIWLRLWPVKGLNVWAVFLLSAAWFTTQAQTLKTYNNWYLGYGAGLTFNGGTPQALTDGQLQSAAGCASISDENGQLLFYTDGNTIWNRRHEIMPGATDLGGNGQSTQAALIVPYQNSTRQFYVFSVASQAQQTGVHYAIVTMSLDGGFGKLDVKNQELVASSTEKITAVNHCNNLNHWIITHDSGSNTFRVNLLNDNGLIPTATLYQVGSVHQQNKGYMKPSHDGKKLAVAVSDSLHAGFLEVFDFDNTTGAITNPVKLENPDLSGPYGVEFSPDNKLLYVSTLFSKKIYQLEVDGLATRAILTAQPQQTYSAGLGALQLGPDGKIYGTQPDETYLMAINQPNQSGPGCEFVAQAVALAGRNTMSGLPFILDDLPLLPPGLTISLKKLAGCNKMLLESQPINLDPRYLLYEWYLNGVAVKDGNGPTYQPTQSGLYSLKVRETKCRDIHQPSNAVSVILVETTPTATAVHDSCGTFLLAAHARGGLVHWTGPGIGSPRDQLDSLTVSGVSGQQTYQIRVSQADDATCFTEKEVTVNFAVPPPFTLADPVRTGCGDTLTVQLNPTSDWNRFRWQLPDGHSATGPSLVARQSGQYHITALSLTSGCKSETELTVMLNPAPVLQLGARRMDTCLTNTSRGYLELNAGPVPPTGVSYEWTHNKALLGTAQRQLVREYGWYVLTVQTPAGCKTSDSLQVVSTCPPMIPVIYMPTAFTPNQDGINETLVIYSSGAEQMTLTIYNRWGETIYNATKATEPSAGWKTWDGTYQGLPVGSGIYPYRLNITSAGFSNTFVKQGSIEVIR